MTEQVTPQLNWFHVNYDVILEGRHIHTQEASEYRGLRFVWTLDTKTGERRSRFYIRKVEYESLNEAITAWKQNKRDRRVRL